MYIRQRKILLWILPIATLLVTLAIVDVSLSAAVAKVAAPTIIDTTKTPGSTFSINITIANAENLWGYEFILGYNTTILTATSYSSYDPFTIEKPSEINDTAGHVSLAFSMELGVSEGFSTVDPAPIARIDFTVESYGNSTLEFKRGPTGGRVLLTTPEADWIPNNAFDGFFTNEAVEAPDIAITEVTASQTTVLIGETVTVNVTIENQGDVGATFNITLYHDYTEFDSQTDITLSPGSSTTLTFTWDTTGLAARTYSIRAQVPVVPGEIVTANNLGSVDVTVNEEKEEGSNLLLYAGAAIALVIVAIILVYIYRARKT